mgnify:CR=1 FL=1
MIEETEPSELKIFVLMTKDRPQRMEISPHGAQCLVTTVLLTKYWSSRERSIISSSLWLLAATRNRSIFVAVGSSEKVISSLPWLNGLFPLISKNRAVYVRALCLLLLSSSSSSSSPSRIALHESEDEKVSVSDGSSLFTLDNVGVESSSLVD